jgi:hypothetical protein
LSNIKFIDPLTGEVYEYEPKPIDFHLDCVPCVIRLVPDMKLCEVAIGVDGDTFRKIAQITVGWPVERPSDRIIFRGWKMNGKVNVFIDYADALEFEPRKVVIPVTRGTLAEHGYATDLIAERRRSILKSIIEKAGEPAISIYRHLIARATQHKRRNPEVAKVLRQDAEWVKKTYYRTDYWR